MRGTNNPFTAMFLEPHTLSAKTHVAVQAQFHMSEAEASNVLSQFFRASVLKAVGAGGEILSPPNHAKVQPRFVDRW